MNFTPVAYVPIKVADGHYEMRWRADVRQHKPLPTVERPTIKPVSAAVAAAQAKLRAERENYERRNYPERFAFIGSLDWRERTKFGKRGTY